MTSDSDSEDLDSGRGEVETDLRAVETDLRAVTIDIEAVRRGTVEARQLRREARRLRDEHQQLTDEVVGGEGMSPNALALADIERGLERRRIALQILAVVVPWRDALRHLDSDDCELFRVRAHALFNYLDVAVLPYPDLQDALAVARRELGSERPSSRSQRLH